MVAIDEFDLLLVNDIYVFVTGIVRASLLMTFRLMLYEVDICYFRAN